MNQINYNQVDEQEKRQIELEFETKQQVIMCPFVIVDGVDDISQGVYTDDPDRFQSASFDRVFQGRNPVIAIWKNSTKAVPQYTEGGIPILDQPEVNAYKTFNVGERYAVILEENGETFFQSFSEDVNGNKRFSTSSSLTIKSKLELDRSYWYDWYLFPELGEEFYYIESINIYRDVNEEFVYSELSVKKVNDELEMVTTNADSLILRSSPGEEYAWPKIVEPEDKRQVYKDVELDETKLVPKGIKYLQITSTEPMLLGSFYAWGRTIEEDEEGNKLITQTRHLLSSDTLSASADPIMGINAPSDKFYWIEQGRVTVGKEYGNWFGQFKENVLSFFGYNDNVQHKNYGAIRIADIDTAVESAPDKESTEFGTLTPITIPQTYWDDWTVAPRANINYGGAANGYKSFSPYSNSIIENRNTSFAEKLARNAFILNSIVQLPMEYEAKVPFGTINAVIGTTRKILLGKDPIYLSNNSVRDSKLDIPLAAEHSYVELISKGLMTGDVGSNANEYLPLQLFSGDRPEILSGKNINTFSIKIELSDKFRTTEGEFNTVDLANPEGFIKYDHNCNMIKTGTAYILDRIIIQAITLGDIKVTAFDTANNAIGSMIVNSNSKKTGSMLDWTTIIKTSEWETEETIPDTTPDVSDSEFTGGGIVFADTETNNTFDRIRPEILEWEDNINLFDLFLEKNPLYTGDVNSFLADYSMIMQPTVDISMEIERVVNYSNDFTDIIDSQTFSPFWKQAPIYNSVTNLGGDIAEYNSQLHTEKECKLVPKYFGLLQNYDPEVFVRYNSNAVSIEIDETANMKIKYNNILAYDPKVKSGKIPGSGDPESYTNFDREDFDKLLGSQFAFNNTNGDSYIEYEKDLQDVTGLFTGKYNAYKGFNHKRTSVKNKYEFIFKKIQEIPETET